MRIKTLLIGFLFIPFTAYLQVLTGPATYVEEKTMDSPVVKPDFETFFLDKTMRLDYYHSGTATDDQFAVDQVVSDGKWPGSKTELTDKLELGQYFFEILDAESKTVIYSRGFSSIFGEWQTTPDADKNKGTFNESIRFPWPKKPVLVILKKRNPENKFQAIWTTTIDPASRQVNPSDLSLTHKVDVILNNGPASEKVDLVILGDGYSKNEMDKFRSDAKRLTDVLLNTEPYKSRKKDLNIRLVETPGEQSGVNKPHPGVFKRTPLSVSYGIFDSERYALTFDNKTVRNVASEVPYDFMVILINEKTYGGGGIYNLYTTVSADNKFADYIMVHELGHHLGALADEYYTSAVSYEAQKITVEPWEPNVTALLDKDNLKWKSLVEPGTPLPTPWNKEEFDRFGYKIQKERDSLRKAKVPENVMEDLFTRQMKQENAFFSTEKYKDKVGAFEGANYTQYGLYRSQLDCIMYTRHIRFCKVCRKSLENVLDQYSH
ncbi:MAG: M64 family metallo-endopeptidase [Bacteroidetes bacterium]|nr:M64 family metallo-endopeptidase [Bacteroidota bacterium]